VAEIGAALAAFDPVTAADEAERYTTD